MKMRGLTRWLCPLWLAVCLASPGSAAAQVTETEVRLTLDPAMVKGSPNAPVIIVEFSDYQ